MIALLLKKRFTEQPHIVMERYSLCTRHQIINESVDTYVECLRVLAGECDFGDQVDKYIRDQLIIRCSNKKCKSNV